MSVTFRDMHVPFRDYATMNFKYLLRKHRVRLLLFPVFFLVIMSMQFYNASNAPGTRDVTGTSVNWIYLAGIGIVFGWTAFSMRRTWRKQYDRTQFLQSSATYTFSDQGVSITSPTTQGAASWETIDTLLLMNELAILTTRNLTVYFLNFRYLEAPATKADFLTMLQQHSIPIK